MKLKIDFSALHRAVAPLKHTVAEFEIISQSDELVSVASELLQGLVLGQDIQLEEIDGSQGILNYNGHQVMLYITDQGDDVEAVLQDGKQGRRIHIAECSTLELMRNAGRFGRYGVISRMDGMFPVSGINPDNGKEVHGESDLGVCKNCLKVLNYKSYEDLPKAAKSEIFINFEYESFFETYSSYFKSLPATSKKQLGAVDYTADWTSISTKFRQNLNYCCEHCGVDMSQYKHLMHVHHINGIKNDNSLENLRGLCADCHKKQPHHGHLHVSRENILLINNLRREQKKFDAFDYDKLDQYADTALGGLISKCRKFRLPTADLGVMVQSGSSVVSIDLAWPRSKVAVLIDSAEQALLESAGWTVFSVGSSMKHFEQFQKGVR
ncbi:HNH endonuclease [Endozoicomonas numazuensis]|uniref:HNH nuclease domain-containing protein n=1 Tax=Endozoicomonas numazuensis TaxID=1137799 RepID=A0A081NJI7_9GAMM|nr:HNH endonuclease [Endozoicomonas numazuensis]KEQ18610.1 hypothetical protein GZ78_00250 [Endozoicomonas numazuensis]